jgi:hypothetical protein
MHGAKKTNLNNPGHNVGKENCLETLEDKIQVFKTKIRR